MAELVTISSAQGTSVIFGLRAPVSGNKTLTITWTGSAEVFAAAISFANVNQTSDGAAFPHTASGQNAATVALASATGHMVVGCQASGSVQGTQTGTSIYSDSASGTVINGQAEYGPGGASVAVGSSGINATIAAFDVSP